MTRAAAVLAVLALATGCTGGSGKHAQPSPSSSINVALAPCPASRAGGSGVIAVTLPCLRGDTQVHLAGLRGKPTVLSLWASWCSDCPAEARALQRAYAAAAGRLRVVGVDTEDSRGHALAFLRDLGVHYPSVYDDDGALRHKLGIPGPPATLFVDARGHVVGTIFGPLDVARLDSYVARFLGVRV